MSTMHIRFTGGPKNGCTLNRPYTANLNELLSIYNTSDGKYVVTKRSPTGASVIVTWMTHQADVRVPEPPMGVEQIPVTITGLTQGSIIADWLESVARQLRVGHLKHHSGGGAVDATLEFDGLRVKMDMTFANAQCPKYQQIMAKVKA